MQPLAPSTSNITCSASAEETTVSGNGGHGRTQTWTRTWTQTLSQTAAQAQYACTKGKCSRSPVYSPVGEA